MITATIVGTVIIVAVTIVIGVLVDRKTPILPRPDKLAPPPRPGYIAGEAPATAIRAGTAQLAKLRTQRCKACRAAMAERSDDHVRYDERELIVLHFQCPRCGAKRSLYVEHVA